MLVLLIGKRIQNRFHGGGKPDRLPLFSSPDFVQILDPMLLFTSMIRGQLRYDLTLGSVAYSVSVAVLRIGTMQIALLASLPKENTARKPLATDLRTSVECLVALFQRSGGALPTIAANFVKAAASVGVVVGSSQIEELDPEFSVELGKVRIDKQSAQSLADAVLHVDKMMQLWMS